VRRLQTEIEEEYGKIFGNTFKKELQERGFIVMPEIPAKDNSSFLMVRVYMANRPPPVPFMTNGYIISTTLIYNQMGKLILRLNGTTLTSSLITTPPHMVKVKLAPYLAEVIAEKFLK
jgi:hypothetical protein